MCRKPWYICQAVTGNFSENTDNIIRDNNFPLTGRFPLILAKYLEITYVKLRSKSKDWLVRNQDNVFKWSDMSTHRLLFQ